MPPTALARYRMAKKLTQRQLAKEVAASCLKRGLKVTVKDDDINAWEEGTAVPKPEIVVALADVLEMPEEKLRIRMGWTYVGDSLSEFGKQELKKVARFAIERAMSLLRAFISWSSMAIGSWLFIEITKCIAGYYRETIDPVSKQLLDVASIADIAVTSAGFLIQSTFEWYDTIKVNLEKNRE